MRKIEFPLRIGELSRTVFAIGGVTEVCGPVTIPDDSIVLYLGLHKASPEETHYCLKFLYNEKLIYTSWFNIAILRSRFKSITRVNKT